MSILQLQKYMSVDNSAAFPNENEKPEKTMHWFSQA